MGKKGFGSKRRTVLQLGDEPRKPPTFGLGYKASDSVPEADGSTNALSGLMSHYAQDSGSDSDSDNDTSPASATIDSGSSHQPKSSLGLPFQKFVAATETSHPSGSDPSDLADNPPIPKEPQPSSDIIKAPTDDIDTKLQDFLAEIESIESKKEPMVDDGIDGVPLSNESGSNQQVITSTDLPTAPVATRTAGTARAACSDDEDDFKLSKPKEPVTKWHQCLDDETQCFYYWHIDSNEVTWEIPAEYSQYLLRYAEYERTLAHYDSELAEWKKAHPNRKPKTSKKKHRRHTKKADNVCIPIVSYPPEDEEPVLDGPVQGPVCKPPLPLIGPTLPEAYPSSNTLSERQSPTGHSAVKSSETIEASNVSSTSEHGIVPNNLTLSASAGINGKVKSTSTSGDCEAVTVSDTESSEISALKAVHEKFVRRAGKSSKDAVKIHGNSNVDKPLNGETSVSNQVLAITNLPDSVTSLMEVSASEPSIASSMDEDDDDKFAQQMLEQPVIVRYDYVNKKYDGVDEFSMCQTEPECSFMRYQNAELDPDAIDKELEKALERKKDAATRKTISQPMSKANQDVFCSKRKANDEFLDDMPLKKVKTYLENSSSNQPIKEFVKCKVNELREVAELASTVTDKLEFLEVNCDGMSKLQILQLQIETRVEDWRAGALSTDHLVAKLRESCATLRQYELSATPPGWSCHWHSSYKRYFYRHDISGESRWDFPDGTDGEIPETEQVITDAPDRLELSDNCAHEDIRSVEADLGSCQPTNTEIEPEPMSASCCPDDPVASTSAIHEPVVAPLPHHSDNPTTTNHYISDSEMPLHSDEPPPPGTESVLPLRLPTNLLSSLAACPPPPPPATPPNGLVVDDVVVEDCNAESDGDAGQQNISSTLQLATTLSRDAESESETDMGNGDTVISALPVLNKLSATDVSSSTSALNTPVMSPSGDCENDGSLSPPRDDKGSGEVCSVADAVPSQAVGTGSTLLAKERKKKKEKALVAGGLTLKKKNVSSLVEKWQKVQQDVTEEISKEEQKLKMKKLAASNSSSTSHE